MTERPAPGEVRPRTLERPPGDRYLPPDRALPLVTRPDLARATLLGGGVAVLVAAVGATLNAALNFPVGVPVVAALGGWVIGRAVRSGAWSGHDHVPRRGPVALAVVLALGTWLATEIGAYLLSLALLPDSVRSLPERIASLSFLDWLGPQFGPLEILSLFLLGGLAWFASRQEVSWPSS